MSWAAEVDPVTSSFLTGRLRHNTVPAGVILTSPPVLELWIDEVLERTARLNREIPQPIEFRLPLPEFCFDAQEHRLELRVGERSYPQIFLSRYYGFIDPFADNLISGWAVDHARPETPVLIEIDINGAVVARTVADVFREDFQACRGFRYQVRETPELQRSFVLRARIAGTDIDVQRSPVLSLARPRVVRAAQQFNTAFHYLEQRLLWDRRGSGPALGLTAEERQTFASLLLEGSDVADVLELRHRFLRPMQPQLTAHYARRDFTSLGVDYPHSVPRRTRTAHWDRPVDVVVPIYAGVRETECCLRSVLGSAAGCRYSLICVLDNPDAPELAALVHGLAAAHPQIQVVEHNVNRGFAESVNGAMLLHRDRDVVILQSDCEVHGDWLRRLQEAAYRGAGAGLVNPLTNHSDFLSYPAPGLELPGDAPFQTLDAIARRVSREGTVTIPAAMGFCLYVRRGCLDDLGFLHNDAQSGGYCAEKYLSVNAAAQGWRSILATDVFVKHRGFVSFAERDGEALVSARNAFESWCPFYRDAVTDFVMDDRSLPAKRELDLARLEQLERENVCFISHGGGGGTERHLEDLTEALRLDGFGAFTLFCLPDRRISLATTALESIENLRYRLDDEWELLVRDLARLRIRHIHIHSNVDVPREMFTLPERLRVAFDVTVHDYAWFCPRVTLVNRSGAYCGEPPVSVCEVCVHGEGGALDAAGLKEISQADLARARHVYCPSHDVLARMRRHFDLNNLVLRPHPEWIVTPTAPLKPLRADERVRVAAIGRISDHKGLRVLRECAAYALEWALPLDFVVVGSTSRDEQFEALTNVEITGPYLEQDAEDLIERWEIRVALLPSVWPETYSYTLSLALRCGLIPVAFDIGAMAERVRRAETGVLLPLGAAPAQVCESLLKAAQQKSPVARNFSTGYLNMLRDYYNLNP